MNRRRDACWLDPAIRAAIAERLKASIRNHVAARIATHRMEP